ncbi:unnamed protein product [Lymnaea stagnalis]|uniref:Ig-like domain-containing protein n=1 Tax=Lymnaea stagnalis TaxID=6523 RepID=A0AAV2HD10_LYMST
MWTTQRLEFQHVVTQLYCRADGTPTPTISWLDRYGRPIVSGQNYTITSVGDLFIRNPTSYNFGAYTCRAVNRAGSDSQWMFFYPL